MYDNDIKYFYYADQACLQQLNGKPVDSGTYYVKAYISGNDQYNEIWTDAVELKISQVNNQDEMSSNILIINLAIIIPITCIASALIIFFIIKKYNKKNIK